VTLKSSGKNSLDVFWKVPDKNLQNSALTGYQVCFYTSDLTPECLALKSTKVLSLTLNNLRPATKYFVTVSAITKAGYGEKSLEVSKITNGGNLINMENAQYRKFYCSMVLMFFLSALLEVGKTFYYFHLNDLVMFPSLEPINPLVTSYYTLSLHIPKQKNYIRYVYTVYKCFSLYPIENNVLH
jgi:hypothetical protein